MRFRIAGLGKLVAVSALLLWLWRSYGAAGVAAAAAVSAMVLVPVGVARLGGAFGEPVTAGALGGSIGWGLLALAIFVFLPGRSASPPFWSFVPVGTLIGALYGLSVFFRKRASKKPRVTHRRRLIGLNVGLSASLIALLFGTPLIGPYRPTIRARLIRAVAPPQPKRPAALPKRIVPAVKSSRSVNTLANAASGTKIGE